MSHETLTSRESWPYRRADQAQIIAGLKRYIQGRINETVERRNFRQRKPASGETFDDYLVSLRELTKTCNFCNNDCLLNNLRDQLVEGIIDPEVVQDLLKEQNLRPSTLVGQWKQPRGSYTHGQVQQTHNTASSESLNAVSRYKQSKGKKGMCPNL